MAKLAYDNIVIPIETTARELNSKLLLSIALARKGFRCFLGTKNLTVETARRLGNAVYIDKGYHRGTSEPIYRVLKEAGNLLVSLDEENGVDFQDFHMLNNRMPDLFLETMDLVLLWGERQNEYLAKNRTQYDPAKIRVTGHPRFDLLKPHYRQLYTEKVESIRQRFGPFVLVNTNSKYSNNITGREAVVANYATRVRGLMERLAYDDERLKLNISLIRRIATQLGRKVVVRPHPEEDIAVYRTAFADLPNVYTEYEDSALYWILAADCVVHNHSTTGMEAAMLGKAPLAYTPITTEENFCPWIPIACSHRATTEDAAIDFIAKEGWRREPPQLGSVLRGFLSFDQDALSQVVSALEDLTSRRTFEGKNSSPILYWLRQNLLHATARLRGRPVLSKLGQNKLEGLNARTVTEHFNWLLAVIPDGGKVRLRQHHPFLYELRLVH